MNKKQISKIIDDCFEEGIPILEDFQNRVFRETSIKKALYTPLSVYLGTKHKIKSLIMEKENA